MDDPPMESAGGFTGTARMVGFKKDLVRIKSLGGVACCVASYGIPKTGIEFERLLTCLRFAALWDLLRASIGIWTCIFLARRRNDFTCWLWAIDGRVSSAFCTIGMACCMPAVSIAFATVADFQYETPPMSGGEGVLMLASSQALTSLMMPEFGLGGRGGGWIEEVCKGGWTLIGIDGIAGISLVSIVVPLEGAVRGRLMDMRSHNPPSLALVG